MILCFDIGGTTIKGALAYSAEDIRLLPRVATPKYDFAAFVGVLRQAIESCDTKPDGVAISIAGVVDEDNGWATVANIPCIHGRDLKADLETELGLRVIIANDADCFVMAEAGIGAGRGHRVVFGIILGTGVGGGLVIDGRLINANGGFAGEWGHAPVAATQAGDPPVHIPAIRCGCGLHGCIDATCSARGLEKLHTLLHHEDRSSQEITDLWCAGDERAASTIQVHVDILASPLALVVNVTGASIVPVAGGLSNSQELLTEIDRAVRGRILRKLSRPLVVKAQCEIEPGLVGAALLGLASLIG